MQQEKHRKTIRKKLVGGLKTRFSDMGLSENVGYIPNEIAI